MLAIGGSLRRVISAECTYDVDIIRYNLADSTVAVPPTSQPHQRVTQSPKTQGLYSMLSYFTYGF